VVSVDRSEYSRRLDSSGAVQIVSQVVAFRSVAAILLRLLAISVRREQPIPVCLASIKGRRHIRLSELPSHGSEQPAPLTAKSK
jgi:hypothetical protein